MDAMPKEIEDALKTVIDYVSGDVGAIEQDFEKEIVVYTNNRSKLVANCAMDSARAVVKDCCKQIVLQLKF